MYLVDTNVVSEARKGTRANPGVRSFVRNVDTNALYLSVLTVGEIRRGIENVRKRGDAPQAGLLEQWLMQVVHEYASRILAFDGECAQVWGGLMSPQNHHPIDKQIAAIALIHDLTVVTRNTADFAGTGVTLLDPFE
jgi:predicted nucleic acid-binding protein